MDFNIFNKSEQDYQEMPILSSIVDSFFAEVEILLTTDQTSVLGQNDFGLDVNTLIWRNRLSAEKIATEIRTAIETYCESAQFVEEFDVTVLFQQGSERDIALVDIEVKPFDEQASQKTYLFN